METLVSQRRYIFIFILIVHFEYLMYLHQLFIWFIIYNPKSLNREKKKKNKMISTIESEK